MINIIFLVLGAVLSLLVAALISYLQFDSSMANHRLKEVVRASKEFIAESKSTNPNFGPLRNKYRYSLGVTLDDFLSSLGSREEKIPRQSNKYPLLIDPNKDRWDRFNFHIRPVLNDLTQHNLFGILFYFKKFKRLKILIQFCLEIELIVSQLDHLYEIKPEYFNFQNGMKINYPEDETFHTENLKQNLEKLNSTWQLWLRTIK